MRETGSSVWVCFAGSGTVSLSGVDHEVEHGDVIAVPSWSPWSWHATEDLVLFRVCDFPVLEAVHLARREVLSR